MPNKPNVVFILTDDQGYGDLGCHGNAIVKTPNLDRFYGESVRLTDYHVGPTCAPTRAGLLTGHYANSTGVWHTIGGRSLLRKDEYTTANMFSDAGYRTGLFGKWHLGDNYPYRPEDRGFHEVVRHGGGGVGNTPDYWGNDYFDDTYCANGVWTKYPGYCTDVWFDLGIDFIERHKDEPFFCYIATNAPHVPHIVDPKYTDPYLPPVSPNESRARYYGMLANIDENFEVLCDKLREWELEEDTILIFMTDNGSQGGVDVDANQFVTSGHNSGMRGKKGSQYDGGHRVPFFIRWPTGGLLGGRDVEELTANIDILPTLMELCRLGDSSQMGFDGTSLLSLLGVDTPNGSPEKPMDTNWEERIVVTDSQRLANPVKWRKSSAMSSRWRLIDGSELYDIRLDPGQTNEVAADHPEEVRRLRSAYEDWWMKVTERADEKIPVEIGIDEPVQALVNSHDWRNVEDPMCVWNQCQVRQGLEYNGYWEIDVIRSGTYTFDMRRWPREANLALTDGIKGTPQVDFGEMTYEVRHTDGKALPITAAELEVGGRHQTQQVKKGQQSTKFTVQLEAGPTNLRTRFYNEQGLDLGAYYVYVEQPQWK
ncbi:MAG: arylsulfatase [SAR202 cluster bacterium]|jgi:arylsulfatase A-like enzyme|nr:arylsulfatase [SAR202 cluster bacterium]